MRFGLILRYGEHFAPAGRVIRWPELRDLATLAEDVGFDTLWVDDHFLYLGEPLVPEGMAARGFWDSFTLLAALAATTRRVTFGPLVACVSFRNPALLAKIADTIDEISGGRLILGLGAGWHEPEYRALGLPFDHLATRFEEALHIITALLREGQVDFVGKYHEARECELRPRGSRPGGVPIWIGARGPRMMRLVARHADAYNTVWYTDPAGVAAPFAALDEACRAENRDSSTILRTSGAYAAVTVPGEETPPQMRPAIRGSAEEIAERVRAFGRAGVEHMTFSVEPWSPAGIERFGRVLELVRRA